MTTTYGWGALLNAIYLVLFLGIGMFLKLKIMFFHKHLVPTSMIAGLIGFLLGNEVLGVIRFDIDVMEKIVYHLMAIGFISLALKDRKKNTNEENISTGFFIVNTYIFQAIIGFGISLLLMYTVFPDLFPNLGMLLPLGFAQGPGQAYSTGSAWEVYDSFSNGGNIGLSIAAIGFLWALIGGVPFMNIIVRLSGNKKEKFNANEIQSIDSDVETTHTGNMPKSIYIDDLTVQIIIIGLVYLITYLFLTGFEIVSAPLGILGETLSRLFWGFNFMFGTLFAILIRFILDKLRKKNVVKVNYADNYLLQRISATTFDFMITAAIAAISIKALKEYLIPVLILTTVGGISTMIYTYIYCRKVYKEHVLEHIVALYGMWTGNITTGVALLKEVDPQSKTAVTEHLVLGSGVAAILGVPLMGVLAIPDIGYSTNQPSYYVLTFIVLIIYSIIIHIGLFREKIFKKTNR